jgi:hypothetical protein
LRSRADDSKFLGDLGVPSLPGGFLDVLSYFSREGNGSDNASNSNNVTNMAPIAGLANASSQITPGSDTPLQPALEAGPSNPPSRSEVSTVAANKGKAKEVTFVTPQLNNISRM